MKSAIQSDWGDSLSHRPAAEGFLRKRGLRVLYFIAEYPTFSETYMHEEIRSLKDECEIKIITYRDTAHARLKPFPYELIEYKDPCLVYGPYEQVDSSFSSPTQREFIEKVGAVIRDFKPDVLHCHYFGLGLLLRHLAEKYHIPFTIRTHSMDVLSEPIQKLRMRSEGGNSPLCNGVFVFPAFRELLLAGGLPDEKLISCPPTINFGRFYKPGSRPPTRRVLCTGPATRKKAHSDFIDLAASMRGTGFTFDLYAKGIYLKATSEHNEQAGGVVNLKYTDPDEMPEVYPQYDWLVYPGSKQINKVGFPVSIPEPLRDATLNNTKACSQTRGANTSEHKLLCNSKPTNHRDVMPQRSLRPGWFHILSFVGVRLGICHP